MDPESHEHLARTNIPLIFGHRMQSVDITKIFLLIFGISLNYVFTDEDSANDNPM